MADSFTPNLNLDLPENNADADTWGTLTNNNWSLLDAMLGAALFGLTLSTAGSSGTFGIAAGGASGMTLASAYTKTTGVWAVGSGLGSLDTGAIAASTGYHVFLIQRTDTGVVDILTSLSATAPTMPSGYTRKRRIGWMKTDASKNWKMFWQSGDNFLWDTPVNDYTFSTVSTNDIAVDLSVPFGIEVEALLRGYMSHATPGVVILIRKPEVSAAVSVAGNYTCASQVSNVINTWRETMRTNVAARVELVSSNPSTTVGITTYGWIDPRGKY